MRRVMMAAAMAAGAMLGAVLLAQGQTYTWSGSCWPDYSHSATDNPITGASLAVGGACRIRVFSTPLGADEAEITNRLYGWSIWTPAEGGAAITVADGSGDDPAGTVRATGTGVALLSVTTPDDGPPLQWTVTVTE